MAGIENKAVPDADGGNESLFGMKESSENIKAEEEQQVASVSEGQADTTLNRAMDADKASDDTNNKDTETVTAQPEASEENGGSNLNEILKKTSERIEFLETELEKMKVLHKEEVDKSLMELKLMKTLSLVKDIAIKQDFIEPEEAALFLKEDLKVVDGELHFKGKKVKEAESEKLITTAVKRLAESRPHLIRFRSKKGSGAVQSEWSHPDLNTKSDFTDPKVRRAYEKELKKRGILPVNPVS